jgi:hypothetical protein
VLRFAPNIVAEDVAVGKNRDNFVVLNNLQRAGNDEIQLVDRFASKQFIEFPKSTVQNVQIIRATNWSTNWLLP